MAKVRQRELPPNPNARAIVKVLADATVWGHSQDRIFEDWLEVVEAALSALPRHAKAISQSGRPADDTPEVKALWERIKKCYGERIFPIYQKAFGLLLEACYDSDSTPTYEDLLGEIYMAWGWPNSNLGQYFTPMSVARMMAAILVPDGAEEVYQRLEEAYRKSKWGQMHALLAEGATERIPAFVREMGPKLVPMCIEHFEPITVMEPCIGSGVLVLAMAAQYPAWAIQMGLVQFYGNDIDWTCVRMARINCMIYGLNAYGLRCYLAMLPEEIEQLPEPHRSAVQEAMQAKEQGAENRVAEIANELRSGQYVQANLFESAEV